MVVSPITIPFTSINLSPGSHLSISGVSWQEYEVILQDLGDERCIPRINYYEGTLELMSPLPSHERAHRMIGYIVTTILEAQERDWEDFGSTTFKKFNQVGLEPDTCFYIANASQVRARQRIDLTVDPPPDLAIEVDITSKTTLDAYRAIKVPEVWIFAQGQLQIYIWTGQDYQESSTSPTFPNLNLLEMIPQLLQQALQQGTRSTLGSLRQMLVE